MCSSSLAGHAGVDPVVVTHEVLRVHHQRVLLPAADRLAVEAADDDVGIGMRPAVEEDGAEAVHEPAHHVDHGGLLHHGDRPHARHDHRQAGGPALADVVAIHLAFGLRLARRVEVLLRLRRELDGRRRRAEAPRAGKPQVVEPGAGEVEGRRRPRLVQVRGRQRAERRGRIGSRLLRASRAATPRRAAPRLRLRASNRRGSPHARPPNHCPSRSRTAPLESTYSRLFSHTNSTIL